MTAVNKIDANITGLRYSEEISLGVADPAAVWFELEPNSYADFGQQVTNVARDPIVADRQKKKGVLTDLDASGGFSGDLTQEVLPDIGQGQFYAAIRVKDEQAVTAVTAAGDDYAVADETGYAAGDLLFAQGHTNQDNNGLKNVVGTAANLVQVAEALIDEVPPAGAIIRRTGFLFAAGDLDVVTIGVDFAELRSTVKDFTQLGLLPGEWIFLGGDVAGAAGDQFLTAANNGFKRIRSIAANVMVLDKSDAAMVDEASVAETVQMVFAPRMLKNESDPALIVRRSYQLERTLGYPDDTFQGLGFDEQVEYLIGAHAATLQMNIATADKMTFDLGMMGLDMEQRESLAPVPPLIGLKPGTRPSLIESEAYNSSSDVARINMHIVSDTEEAPTPLFGFIQEMAITIDNTLSPNKAVGVFGAFEITAGMFAVSGTLTAYFSEVGAMIAIRNNEDVSIDFHLVKANQGISIDMPLLTIGDGRPNVESDTAITLPISFEAASGAKVDPALDHTLMMLWWDFLPNAADV